MRKVIDLQMEFWKKDIANVEFDLESRDEIPKLLMGLQYIYSTPAIREKVFNVLKQVVPKKSYESGRPGMDLWKILVLATLRLNCNWDFDKVHEMANNHYKLRQMLGHRETDFESNYPLQTIRDNIALLTPPILDEVNQIVVKAGHSIISPDKDPQLRGSCDSFVVETDVHYPTDTNLLFDAMRKMISLIAIICSEVGITAWRQSHHNILKVKRLLRGVQKLRRSTSKDEAKRQKRDEFIIAKHQHYIDVCQGLVIRVKETIHILRELGILSMSQELRLITIEEYIRHAERQIDQICRRVVFDEKIPHREKVFSIFQPHTEWISKGKVSAPVELGHKVLITTDQDSLILDYKVMTQSSDVQETLPLADRLLTRFGEGRLQSWSVDKGFSAQQDRDLLELFIPEVIMPKKGRRSHADLERETQKSFRRLQRQHSGIESNINALEHHGLNRCPDKGWSGFQRYVGLGVLAYNLHKIGNRLLAQDRQRQPRLKHAA